MQRIILNGQKLKIKEVYQVSKGQVDVDIDPECKESIDKGFEVIEKARNIQKPVYGLTRDVGQFKDETLDPERNYDQEVVNMHSTYLGGLDHTTETYSLDACKGAWLILLNGFLNGSSFVSWELLQTMTYWINGAQKDEPFLKIEKGISIGMADAIPLMQMAKEILPKFNYKVKNGEGLALLSSNALSMSEASLVTQKLQKVLSLSEMSLALALLAENGNLSIIENPGLNASKHWPEKMEIVERIRKLLESTSIESNNDSPHSHLTLRGSCDNLASAKESLKFSGKVLEEMINSHQGNPFVDIESGTIGSVANFDTTRLFNVFTFLQTSIGTFAASLVRRGEYKVNQYGETMNRRAIVERYILWHLETSGRSAALSAQQIPSSLSRLAGAKGIEDWAPPFPDLCSRLTHLAEFTKRVLILESLISAMIVKERKIEIEKGSELQTFFALLVQHSPLKIEMSQTYSMESLFRVLSQEYEI